jgi:hypothetical protein
MPKALSRTITLVFAYCRQVQQTKRIPAQAATFQGALKSNVIIISRKMMGSRAQIKGSSEIITAG